eukprot:1195152-Prorocentrum_minimum.AAC.6
MRASGGPLNVLLAQSDEGSFTSRFVHRQSDELSNTTKDTRCQLVGVSRPRIHLFPVATFWPRFALPFRVLTGQCLLSPDRYDSNPSSTSWMLSLRQGERAACIPLT